MGGVGEMKNFPSLGFPNERYESYNEVYVADAAPFATAAVWYKDRSDDHYDCAGYRVNVYHNPPRSMPRRSPDNRLVRDQGPMLASDPVQACALIHHLIQRYQATLTPTHGETNADATL